MNNYIANLFENYGIECYFLDTEYRSFEKLQVKREGYLLCFPHFDYSYGSSPFFAKALYRSSILRWCLSRRVGPKKGK